MLSFSVLPWHLRDSASLCNHAVLLECRIQIGNRGGHISDGTLILGPVFMLRNQHANRVEAGR